VTRFRSAPLASVHLPWLLPRPSTAWLTRACAAAAGEQQNWHEVRLSFSQFREGFKELNYQPAVLISQAAWDHYIVAERLIDESGRIPLEGFRRVLLSALTRWQLRQLNRGAHDDSGWVGEKIRALFFGVKGLVFDPDAQDKPQVSAGDSKGRSHLRTLKMVKTALARVEDLHSRFDSVEEFYRATDVVAVGGADATSAVITRVASFDLSDEHDLVRRRAELERQLADLDDKLSLAGIAVPPARPPSSLQRPTSAPPRGARGWQRAPLRCWPERMPAAAARRLVADGRGFQGATCAAEPWQIRRAHRTSGGAAASRNGQGRGG